MRALCSDPTLHSRERDRVECLLLSDRGLKVPALAPHAAHFVASLRHALPGDHSRVAVLNNASIHRSKGLKAA